MKNALNVLTVVSFVFIVCCSVHAQTLTGMTPRLAAQDQGLQVTITAQGATFYQSVSTVTQVWLSNDSSIIQATAYSGIDASTVEARFDIPVNAPAGMWTVHVSDSVDGELPGLDNAFMIYKYPDLDNDGQVDMKDISLLIKHWLEAAVEIPNLIGMNQAEAEFALVSASLVLGAVIQEYHDTIAAGDVINSDPTAGTTVQAGSAVNLVISQGPYTVVEPDGMVWVEVNDPGVSGHEAFAGQMSKYETTNAQFCQFLNAALASGDVAMNGDEIVGANGYNEGEDYLGLIYYNMAGAGYDYNGAASGGAARIYYNGGSFHVDSGFENHPVTYVSWYGATAFSHYYGYRLPTEWEWQAVADYDGSFNYGCGANINNTIANYYGSAHPQGTTAGGNFGTYGYEICDMSGNVWEWTSTISSNYRVIRGGGWNSLGNDCSVTAKYTFNQINTTYSFGFRVCR